MKTIAVLTATRAEYGQLSPVIKKTERISRTSDSGPGDRNASVAGIRSHLSGNRR